MMQRIFRWRHLIRTAALVPLFMPVPVQAHLVSTGMGPVYDGIGHVLLTPEDLVPALAMALYAGLRGAAHGRRTLWALPLAWFAGGLAGTFLGPIPLGPIPTLSFLILGGLVAADCALPPALVTGLSILLGLVHGFLNGAALREGPGVFNLMGIVAILFVLVALASAGVVVLQKQWQRIAVRVVGSWITAVGLLMIGWQMR